MESDPKRNAQRCVALFGAIEALSSLDELHARLPSWREALAGLLCHGASGLSAAKLISAVNDALTVKIIDLLVPRFRLPPIDWCWLALGSEGRGEQTLVTDQDNALIFEASSEAEAEALRNCLLPFAQAVNTELARAGFPLCKGGIMAGNPDCCLSWDEWHERFIEWVRRPDPEALLNATIFFDLRPLRGEAALLDRLQERVLAMTADTPAFQHLLAANAVSVDVPLNFLGEVSGEESPLDLKKFGSRIFVDAARIFALACGLSAVSTTERLAAAAAQVGLAAREQAAMVSAFSHILRLRLEHQLATGAYAQQNVQELRPGDLNEMDRAILREALKQARRLQQRLKLNYLLQ